MLCPLRTAQPHTLCKDFPWQKLLVACPQLPFVPAIGSSLGDGEPWHTSSPALHPQHSHIFTEALQPLAQEVLCIANEHICICNEDPSQVLPLLSSLSSLLPAAALTCGSGAEEGVPHLVWSCAKGLQRQDISRGSLTWISRSR